MKEIALIGLVQTLFYALLITAKKRKNPHDYLLIVFLLFVGAELLYRYLITIHYEPDNRWLALFDITYWSLFGPVTLFYFLTLTGAVTRLKPLYAVHLIPLLISVQAVAGFLNPQSASHSFVDYFNASTGLTKAGLFVWDFSSPLYLLYTFHRLKKHMRSLKEHFSDVSGRDARWLMIVVSGYLVYIVLSYLMDISKSLFTIEFGVSPFYVLPAVLTVYVFFVGFNGFRQEPIVFSSSAVASAKGRNTDDKYCKSGLCKEERAELVAGLKALMEKEKPYLDNDLTLTDLAVKLDTNFHKLSQVINESMHHSFYDLINTYRIEESKQLLQCPEAKKYTIISIAQDVGFSSKSSFYNAFRKNAGMTPGQYLEQVRINVS